MVSQRRKRGQVEPHSAWTLANKPELRREHILRSSSRGTEKHLSSFHDTTFDNFSECIDHGSDAVCHARRARPSHAMIDAKILTQPACSPRWEEDLHQDAVQRIIHLREDGKLIR
jgi:hypothetical protein